MLCMGIVGFLLNFEEYKTIKFFEQLIVWLLEGKEIFDEKQQYRLFSCEQV